MRTIKSEITTTTDQIDAPTWYNEDVVIVIRCKDCARYDNCFMYRESGNDYGFCAWAYRRKE